MTLEGYFITAPIYICHIGRGVKGICDDAAHLKLTMVQRSTIIDGPLGDRTTIHTLTFIRLNYYYRVLKIWCYVSYKRTNDVGLVCLW